jgi:hypothetical protein
VTIFYCLRFETSLFVASYDSQGHGGGIRTRLHTGIVIAAAPRYMYSFGTDHVENVSPNSSSIVASRSYRTEFVENTVLQLVHCCMLRTCCLETGLFA